MLLESVWNLHFDPQTNLIDVHMSRLRQAIDRDFSPPLLHTVRGSGYCLKDPGETPLEFTAAVHFERRGWQSGTCVGVTIGVSALLLSVYLLTQRAMERQVDLVVETEIESLREDYRGGGRKRLIERARPARPTTGAGSAPPTC